MEKGFKTGIKLINGIILLSLLLVNCGSSRELAITNSNLVRAAATKLPADFAALWDKRHIEKESLAGLTKINDLIKENPSNYELLIIGARANYIYADGHLYVKMTEENEAVIKAEQKKVYDLAIQYSEKAMALDPKFRTAVLGGTKVEEAINGLDKDYIDSIYWRYASLARWSRLDGTITLLKNKGKFSQMVKRIEALDPNYFFGAVNRFYGGSETLTPGGSMAKGKENFEKAIKIENNFFGNHVLYADVWATKKGDSKLFDKELNFVINAKPEVLGKPEWLSEQIVEQLKAKKIIQEKDQRNLE